MVGQYVTYLFVYVSRRELPSRATLRRLLLGDVDRQLRAWYTELQRLQPQVWCTEFQRHYHKFGILNFGGKSHIFDALNTEASQRLHPKETQILCAQHALFLPKGEQVSMTTLSIITLSFVAMPTTYIFS